MFSTEGGIGDVHTETAQAALGVLGAEGVSSIVRGVRPRTSVLSATGPRKSTCVGMGCACWAVWGWGQRREVSVPFTGLFFQMIESNDISGEKIRMKETVEGEWPLGKRDASGKQAGWLVLPSGWVPLGFASSAS